MYNYVFHDEVRGKWLSEIRIKKAPAVTDDMDKVKRFQFKRRDSAEAYCKAINDTWGTHYVVMFKKY